MELFPSSDPTKFVVVSRFCKSDNMLRNAHRGEQRSARGINTNRTAEEGKEIFKQRI